MSVRAMADSLFLAAAELMPDLGASGSDSDSDSESVSSEELLVSSSCSSGWLLLLSCLVITDWDSSRLLLKLLSGLVVVC